MVLIGQERVPPMEKILELPAQQQALEARLQVLEMEGLQAFQRDADRIAPEASWDARPAPSYGDEDLIQVQIFTGFPDLIVPAGFTGNGLPVTLSFLGVAFSEPRLLALGYAFEQKTRARRIPVNTPALPGETVEY